MLTASTLDTACHQKYSLLPSNVTNNVITDLNVIRKVFCECSVLDDPIWRELFGSYFSCVNLRITGRFFLKLYILL